MPSDVRKPSEASSAQRPATPEARERTPSRLSGGLARNAVAAGELPFSALFYWID